MSRKKNKILIISIIVLAFLAGNFIEPKYWNQAADFINFPHFPQIQNRQDFKLGLDLQGGTHLIYEADLSQISQEDYDSALQGLRDVIERRVNLFGAQEPIVQIQETPGHYRLIVELAGVHDPGQAIEMIGRTPFLEFKEQKENYDEILAKADEVNKLFREGKNLEEIQNIIEDWYLAFEDPFQSAEPALTGKYLKKAQLDSDQSNINFVVALQFDEEGAKIFEDLTEKNINKILAIYIDETIISAPRVNERIAGGRAQISGGFSRDEARDLANNLSAGALPVPINLISQQTVGPTLGQMSLEKSFQAGLYGFLAVLLFIILFYRLPGFLAAVSLIFYAVFILALFKLIPITLTLAGIGGFILSIGMAVDANVLIFSRMREELEEGRTFSQSVSEGFRRAWPSIRDGNLTTLIVAIILFFLGSSFVKGFALTLFLGILLSMFSAIFITRNFLEFFKGTRWEKYSALWK